MAARDRITNLYPDPNVGESDLASSIEQSQDILFDMLKERFERVVDVLLEHSVGADEDRQKKLDALFALYEEELLTKSEVRRRGGLEPEEFYDELRSYRQRSTSF